MYILGHNLSFPNIIVFPLPRHQIIDLCRQWEFFYKM